MKFGKILTAAAAVMAMTCCVHAADAVSVVVNDAAIDINAVIRDGRTLVPLRGVYEQLGYSVNWYAESKLATFEKGEKYMSVDANDGSVYIGAPYSSIAPQVKVDTDVPAQVINDRLYLPLRAASEGLGLTVDWDGETKTVYVKSGEVDEKVTEDIDIGDVKADNSFAYSMNELMPRDKNYMFSPLSIKMALALAANGADGETKAEIVKTAGLGDLEKYNAYARALINTYAEGEEEEKEYYEEYYGMQMPEKTQLSIANSVWLNTDRAKELGDVSFNDGYIKNMRQNFDADIEKVDQTNAVDKINSWCSKKTNGKIPSIIDSPEFLAALVNAVYFKAGWINCFDEYATHEDTFTDRDGKAQKMEFMSQTEDFMYYEDKDIRIVRMPYNGGTAAMYVVLSNDKRVDITPYMDKMSTCQVHIKMPKFKVEYSETINGMLQKLGINTAFSVDTADFTKMLQGGANRFYVDKILHKTFIEVDENGTEAAAVTAIMVEGAAMFDPEPVVIKEFIADKPFSYFIVDSNTDEILFMGEVAYAK